MISISPQIIHNSSEIDFLGQLAIELKNHLDLFKLYHYLKWTDIFQNNRKLSNLSVKVL